MTSRADLILSLALVVPLACGSRSLPAASGDAQVEPGADRALSSSARADASCQTVLGVRPPVAFDCDQRYHAGGIEVSAGKVYYTASSASGNLDLFVRDAGAGTVRQFTTTLRAELLAAAAGDVLYAEQGPDPAASQLHFLRGSHLVPLGTRSDPGMDGVRSLYTGRPGRLISEGAAVWRAGASIFRYDGVSTRTIAGGIQTPYDTEIDHSTGSVVWRDQQDIFLHRSGTVTRLSHDKVDDRSPQLSGGSVYWLCGEAVCRWDGKTTEQLDHGKCMDLAARQGRAAWVCDGQVMVFDGSTARAVAGSRGDKEAREGLRLDGERLLWLQAPAGYGDFGDRGTVYLFDGVNTLKVAEVGLPCLVCNADWPPLQLALDGDVAAWSYHWDGTQPADGPRGGPCAYSVIEPGCGR